MDTFHSLLSAGFALQRSLYENMAETVHSYHDAPRGVTMLWLYGGSFAYGVLHAVGPGHGKTAISSYLMASGERVRRGLAITLLSSLLQAGSAIALVGVLALVLHRAGRSINAEVQTFESVSYGLIVALGGWMLVQALRGHHHHHHSHSHDTHDHHDHGHPHRTTFWLVAGAVGIRPCSGAVLVLLFTLGQGIFAVGMGAAVVMSLGTAFTVTLLALFALGARQSAMRLLAVDGSQVAWFEKTLGIAAALVVIVAGGIFLLASLQSGSSL